MAKLIPGTGIAPGSLTGDLSAIAAQTVAGTFNANLSGFMPIYFFIEVSPTSVATQTVTLQPSFKIQVIAHYAIKRTLAGSTGCTVQLRRNSSEAVAAALTLTSVADGAVVVGSNLVLANVIVDPDADDQLEVYSSLATADGKCLYVVIAVRVA